MRLQSSPMTAAELRNYERRSHSTPIPRRQPSQQQYRRSSDGQVPPHQQQLDLSMLATSDADYLDQLLLFAEQKMFVVVNSNIPNYYVIYASPALCNFLGCTEQEICGSKYFSEMVCETNIDRQADRLRTIFALQSATPLASCPICFKKDTTPFLNHIIVKTLFGAHSDKAVYNVAESTVYDEDALQDCSNNFAALLPRTHQTIAPIPPAPRTQDQQLLYLKQLQKVMVETFKEKEMGDSEMSTSRTDISMRSVKVAVGSHGQQAILFI
eukprot:c17535_g1_i1.p1 GENE.c17535_g1_i1~~c17535_g1_i1.p1  ORF type:complete len:269 (+),score=49.31 c17535_g1_i1:207-1013(+)